MSHERSPFLIKLCGLTSPADCVAAVVAGPTAVGLNFFAGSSRYVSPAQAAEIVAVLPPEVLAVGVFVDSEPDNILAITEEVPLQAIQLHGAETPQAVAAVKKRLGESKIHLVKALATGKHSVDDLKAYLQACAELGALPDAVLIDAGTGAKAGHGALADWQIAKAVVESLKGQEDRSRPQVILAGGLTPANVAEAIHQVRPDGVDVASGVEASRGVKDPLLMSDFVTAARRAFRDP